MPFNDQVATRIREQLRYFPDVLTEKRMFGGLVFLYKGKMTIGAVNNDLMVRVIEAKIDDELSKKHVRPMDFVKKPMKEYIYVSQDGIKTELELLHYIELGLEHAKYKLGE
ncbi:TfoX/Sxy family protein [uncultured Lacinutrix sp.]|uniref:TfoX/Sxy family protein n=1 Tax=uncultured Lacinutrix sp. TaxID=574032 RepID=UPI0026152EBC|nr:TfoX/Sxy family protein [uncultured Lacinutrix sp.]